MISPHFYFDEYSITPCTFFTNNFPMESPSNIRSFSSLCATSMSQYTLSDFTCFQKLGEGAFGRVYLARRKSDDVRVCIKMIPLKKSSSDRNAIQEAETLSKLDHVNIIKSYGSFTCVNGTGEVLCIVMEYAPFGSLEDLIRV